LFTFPNLGFGNPFEAGIGWNTSDVIGKVTSQKIILKPGFFY
jgi:hypothetical protein